jgi:hypothetical protein
MCWCQELSKTSKQDLNWVKGSHFIHCPKKLEFLKHPFMEPKESWDFILTKYKKWIIVNLLIQFWDNFCNWLFRSIKESRVYLQPNFNFCQDIKSQKIFQWDTENPHLITRSHPPHNHQVGVSRSAMLEEAQIPRSFVTSINSEWYVNNILSPSLKT